MRWWTMAVVEPLPDNAVSRASRAVRRRPGVGVGIALAPFWRPGTGQRPRRSLNTPSLRPVVLAVEIQPRTP